MSYGLDLLRDDRGFSWFAKIIDGFQNRKAPADWASLRRTIWEELKSVNPALHEGPNELDDDAARITIGFYEDGSVSISISGWGDWHTRARQIRMYLNVFEKHGFAAYDQQAEEKWKRERSVSEIRALLERFQIPELTSTGKGCSLKPLTDDEWDRMM